MKTLHFFPILALLLVGACSVCIDEANLLPDEQKTVVLEFTATTGEESETKTEWQPNDEIWWNAEEEICIFYGNSGKNKFTSTNDEKVKKATFTGTITAFTGETESGDFNYFWAVYPYDAAVSCNGSSVVATLPQNQTAQVGSFSPKTNLTLAKSAGLSLAFYNVCAWFRFSVAQEGVKVVTFKGNNNEDIAGTFSVSMGDNGRPTAPIIENGLGQKEIRLTLPENASFEVGENYYFTLLPQTFSKGFTLSFEKEISAGIRSVNSSVVFSRNIYHWGNNFDRDIVYESIIPNDELWYTTTNGNAITPARTDNWGKSITSYTTHGDFKVIKFSGDISTVPLNAFLDKTTLSSVYLPDGVTSVGNSAFKGCTSLSKAALPENLNDIQYQAFFGCTSLSEVNIPSSLSYISSYAFSGCGFTNICIPNGVVLYDNVFSQCGSLISITLPSDMTSIRDGLFYWCENLESITIPDGVLSIGKSAFSHCSSLGSIALPNGLETIGENAFGGCTSLSSISIPQNVSTIGKWAFQNVPISNITLPASVETVGEDAFKNCSNLTVVTLNTPNVMFGSVFSNTPIEEITGDYASANGLYYVNGNTLKGFARAAGVTNVVIPSIFTAIDNWAFGNCPSITSITLPDELSTIGYCAFSGCSGLSSIIIPSSVTSMGNGVLADCSGLTSITVLPTSPPTGGVNMFRNSNNCPILVPAESEESYEAAENWSTYASRIQPIVIEAIDLSANGTANSYIVSQKGLYKFAATKGNSNESVGTIKGVKVLWESFGNTTVPDIGDLIKPSVSYADGYITFETNDVFREGNALIAVYSDAACSDGNVLWSWHIWMTDVPAEQEYANNVGTMMDRNLGATSATPGEVGTYGLFYQWGRKDPFLTSGTHPVSTTLASSTYVWPTFVSSDATHGTIDYATKNPTTYIYKNSNNKDWVYSGPSYRWEGSNADKTIYDPCPPGWFVPDVSVWKNAGFPDVIDGSVHRVTYDETHLGVTFSASLCGSDSWYPSTGAYYMSTSINQLGWGCMWSATLNDGWARNYYFQKNSDGTATPCWGTFEMYNAMPVRCIKK